MSETKMPDFEYNRKDDIAVFEYKSYDNYERSIDIANFIIDLDDQNNFLGLEVIGASERLPLSKEELSKIDSVEIEVKDEEESMIITVLMTGNGEKTSLNLPVKNVTGQPA